MADEPRLNNANDAAEARPMWMQVTFGLLMGAVAMIVLVILLTQMG